MIDGRESGEEVDQRGQQRKVAQTDVEESGDLEIWGSARTVGKAWRRLKCERMTRSDLQEGNRAVIRSMGHLTCGNAIECL